MTRVGPFLFGADDQVRAWINERLDGSDLQSGVTIGIVRDGRMVAGAAYFAFRWPSVEIAMAAETPRWATPEAVQMVTRDYPFGQLRCNRLTAVTREDNARARRFMEGIGFEREGRMRLAYPDGCAGILYGLLRNDHG